jgi:IS30 family transposase
LKADGLSLRAIARALDRAASTISLEVRRNALDSGAEARMGSDPRPLV